MTGEIRRILSFEPLRAKNNSVIILALISSALYFLVIGIYLGRSAEDINSAFSEFRQIADAGFQEGELPFVGWIMTDEADKIGFQTGCPGLHLGQVFAPSKLAQTLTSLRSRPSLSQLL